MECQVCISLLEQNLFHMNQLKCHQNKILEEIFTSKKYLELCFKSGCPELASKTNLWFPQCKLFLPVLQQTTNDPGTCCTLKETSGILKYAITQYKIKILHAGIIREKTYVLKKKKGGISREFNIINININIINIDVTLGKCNVKANWKTQEKKLKDLKEGGRIERTEGSTWMERNREILSLFLVV